MTDRLFKRIFIVALVFILVVCSFGYGALVGNNKIWPHYQLRDGWAAIDSFVRLGKFLPRGLYVEAPAGASRQPFTIHRPELITEGFYIFLGRDAEINQFAAWLYDHKGQLLHRWVVDYEKFDPGYKSDGFFVPHAFHVLNDGSLLIGFDGGEVMVRINACNEPMWIKKGIFHHSLTPADNGSFWVWRSDRHREGQDQYLQNFDADTGETIVEIDLVEDIVKPMGAQSFIFGIRPDYPFQRYKDNPTGDVGKDIFHPNDLDVLTAELAPAFPMFEVGDLLLSFRTPNLVVVVDGDDYRVKWYQNGPWKLQHDPDFTADGTISVYSNFSGNGRSEIIRIDPATREASNELYPGDLRFNTHWMGKHQYLPDGRILIIVPGQGRAIEVTADGDKVLEFNNIVINNPDYNAHIDNGMWVDTDFFKTIPSCIRL